MAVEQGSYKGVTLYQGEDFSKRIAEIDAQTAAPTSTPTATKSIDTSKLSKEISADDLEDDDGPSFQDAIAGQMELQQKAFKGVLESMMISPEEREAQAQIDALNQEAALRKNYSEGQGMDLEFVQGQQANIERQRAIKTSALEQKLARLQQGRLTQGEIYQALYNGVNHQMDTALKLQQATMPQLHQTIIDDKTGLVMGIIQNADGSFTTKALGSTSPETKIDFDVQGSYRSGGNYVVYGTDKDGKFVQKTLGASDIGAEGEGGGVFSVAELIDLGLPLSVLQLGEEEFVQQILTPTPPDWWQEFIQAERSQDPGRQGDTVSSQEAGAAWQEFRAEALQSAEVANAAGNDFGYLNLPPPVQ